MNVVRLRAIAIGVLVLNGLQARTVASRGRNPERPSWNAPHPGCAKISLYLIDVRFGGFSPSILRTNKTLRSTAKSIPPDAAATSWNFEREGSDTSKVMHRALGMETQ
jgi:hypothetical protein